MIKITELTYSKELLEEYLNKKGYTFLGFIGDKMIFKYIEKTSRQVVAKTNTQEFFDASDERLTQYAILLSESLKMEQEQVKIELLKFISYRTEKNENSIKCKWQKEKTFEVKARLKTWFGNIKSIQKPKEKYDCGFEIKD